MTLKAFKNDPLIVFNKFNLLLYADYTNLWILKSLTPLVRIWYTNLPLCSFSYLDFSVFSLNHGLHDIFLSFPFCCLQRLLGGFDRFGGAIARWYRRCVPHQHLSAIISISFSTGFSCLLSWITRYPPVIATGSYMFVTVLCWPFLC